jgi:hypothetical protein
VAVAGDHRQPPAARAGELGARIVEQDGARLRRHEVVGARQHLAQVLVEAHLQALELAIAPGAHQKARDLLGRQRVDLRIVRARHAPLANRRASS